MDWALQSGGLKAGVDSLRLPIFGASRALTGLAAYSLGAYSLGVTVLLDEFWSQPYTHWIGGLRRGRCHPPS